MQIKTLAYTNLLKLELPALATKVITIIEKHNPEKLRIKELYDMLVAQTPNINILNQKFGLHPLTQEIKSARKMCYLYAQSITYFMRAEMKQNADNPSCELLNAAALAKDYLHRLVRSENESVMLERVAGFFIAYDNDVSIQATFEDARLTRDIENLRSANSNLIDLLSKRLKSISERPQLKTKEINVLVIKALKSMFMQIEVAYMQHSDLNYVPLINELNETIMEHKNVMKRRMLHNKRKTKAKEANAAANESKKTVVPYRSRVQAPSVKPPQGYDLINKLKQQLQFDKTDVSSQKLYVLPLEEDDS